MACRGVAPPERPGGRALLRLPEACGLLQSLLQPEALLNAGQLDQCYSALKVRGPLAGHAAAV